MAITVTVKVGWISGEAPEDEGEVVLDEAGLGFDPMLWAWTLQTDSATEVVVDVMTPIGQWKGFFTIAPPAPEAVADVVYIGGGLGDFSRIRVTGLSSGAKVHFYATRKPIPTR